MLFATAAVMAPVFHPHPSSAQIEDKPFDIDSVQTTLKTETLEGGNVRFEAKERSVEVIINENCDEDPQSFTITFIRRNSIAGQRATFGVVYTLEVGEGITSRRLRTLSVASQQYTDSSYAHFISTNVSPGWYGLLDDPESINEGAAIIRGVQLECRPPLYSGDN